MARSIPVIYDELVGAKESHTELDGLQPNVDSSQNFLDDLTSTSKVAVWRSFLFCVAVGIWSLEKLMDVHKAWIELRAKELIVGTAAWYAKISLEFQYGDALVYADDVYKYAVINPANQIIKLVSVNEVGGQVLLKVAKHDAGGLPIPLTPTELTAFQNYIFKLKFAGVKVIVVSRIADLLKVFYTVYYDPLILSSTGELINSPGTFPVEDAINNYIKNLPFDGTFVVTQLTDKIQAALGVVNPVFSNASAKYGANPYVVLGPYYKPNGGYLSIDPAFTLNSTVTYTPYNG